MTHEKGLCPECFLRTAFSAHLHQLLNRMNLSVTAFEIHSLMFFKVSYFILISLKFTKKDVRSRDNMKEIHLSLRRSGVVGIVFCNPFTYLCNIYVIYQVQRPFEIFALIILQFFNGTNIFNSEFCTRIRITIALSCNRIKQSNPEEFRNSNAILIGVNGANLLNSISFADFHQTLNLTTVY